MGHIVSLQLINRMSSSSTRFIIILFHLMQYSGELSYCSAKPFVLNNDSVTVRKEANVASYR